MVCDNGAVRSRGCTQPMSDNVTSKSGENLCDKASGPTGQEFDRVLDMGNQGATARFECLYAHSGISNECARD